jgi:hypothetical protein
MRVEGSAVSEIELKSRRDRRRVSPRDPRDPQPPPLRHPTLTMADDAVLPIPDLKLPQLYFTLTKPSLSHLHDDARRDLLEGIKNDRTSLTTARSSTKANQGNVS